MNSSTRLSPRIAPVRLILLTAATLAVTACQGPAGPAGPQGPVGETGVGGPGPAGSTGPMGQPGQNGQNGSNGQNGTNGMNGQQGPAGDAGLNGRDFRFSGPGLVVTVLDAGVVDGGAVVDVKLADSTGRELDRTGILTEGAVSVSFVLGYLEERSDGLPLQYVSYTKRNVAFDGGTFVQNAAESNGVWSELGLGTYRYQLSTPIAVGANANKTHTLGLYATRTSQGVRYVDNALFDFRPDGQPVTKRRDIVTDQACNTCHTRLEAHGGARRDIGLCILCHTNTNDIDPESGNSFDFKAMVHNLHAGPKLASVDAGTPYLFVGFNNAVSNFSNVRFPGSLNACETCHTGTDGDRWKTNATAENCSGCHDRTWFVDNSPPAGFRLHSVGPRTDAQCMICHAETSVAPIPNKHPAPNHDPGRVNVSANIISVPATAPGSRPTVTFGVNVNGQPRDVLAARLSRLRFVFGGPNTDVDHYLSETAETAADCAVVTDGGACLERLDAGVFRYRALNPMAATDVGSFTLGMEVCTNNDAGVRYCALNPVAPFAVTDATAVPRRKPVTQAQCNTCHQNLSAHGGSRNNAEHCTVCHGGNLVENVTTPRDGGAVTAPAANFKDLVHRIHAQAEYPSPLNHCQKCHTATSFSLPLPSGLLPSKSEVRTCNLALPDGGPSVPSDGGVACLPGAIAVTPVFEQPTAAACTSCHLSVAASAHAMLNTTASGLEACAVCHAPGRSAGVDVAHAVAP